MASVNQPIAESRDKAERYSMAAVIFESLVALERQRFGVVNGNLFRAREQIY